MLKLTNRVTYFLYSATENIVGALAICGERNCKSWLVGEGRITHFRKIGTVGIRMDCFCFFNLRMVPNETNRNTVRSRIAELWQNENYNGVFLETTILITRPSSNKTLDCCLRRFWFLILFSLYLSVDLQRRTVFDSEILGCAGQSVNGYGSLSSAAGSTSFLDVPSFWCSVLMKCFRSVVHPTQWNSHASSFSY